MNVRALIAVRRDPHGGGAGAPAAGGKNTARTFHANGQMTSAGGVASAFDIRSNATRRTPARGLVKALKKAMRRSRGAAQGAADRFDEARAELARSGGRASSDVGTIARSPS